MNVTAAPMIVDHQQWLPEEVDILTELFSCRSEHLATEDSESPRPEKEASSDAPKRYVIELIRHQEDESQEYGSSTLINIFVFFVRAFAFTANTALCPVHPEPLKPAPTRSAPLLSRKQIILVMARRRLVTVFRKPRWYQREEDSPQNNGRWFLLRQCLHYKHLFRLLPTFIIHSSSKIQEGENSFNSRH